MTDHHATQPAYFEDQHCDLGAFTTLIGQTTQPGDVPHATDIQNNVPIYDMAPLRPALEQPDSRRALMGEWARVLRYGAGAMVLQRAYADTAVLDDATAIYETVIARERAESGGKADHFAAAGANDRIWNALQKLCEADPETYIRYFANTAIAAACEAWLGPNYQMTAQVNLVHPGGAAQQAHRDYHLGFQTDAISRQYPAHVHDLSPVLTLQGAVAHCDMPLNSGPTKLLPFSQAFRAGYTAWRREDFRALFEARHVQLPLAKGDALFFSPALFHGAGANTSADIHRMANLLQVSSALGRAMETIDRAKMCRLIYPHLMRAELSAPERAAVIAATAEGYAFPTNLDRDPPKGGLAPETQAAYLTRALTEAVPPQDLSAHLTQMAANQQS